MLAKAVLFFMLIWIAALSAYLLFVYQMKTGTAYYVDTGTAGINPVQPRFRIPFTKVKQRPAALAVYYDSRGNLYEIKHLSYGKETHRVYYYFDMHHRLRYMGFPDAWGDIQLKQVSPP